MARLESVVARLERALAERDETVTELDRRIAELEKLLEDSRRSRKRQAAPFPAPGRTDRRAATAGPKEW